VMKCTMCGKHYPLCELYCLTSGRGANENCTENCVLICENCMKAIDGWVKETVEKLKVIVDALEKSVGSIGESTENEECT